MSRQSRESWGGAAIFVLCVLAGLSSALPTDCTGDSCGKACNPGCKNACNATSGACFGGCKPGWAGITCDRPCRQFHYGANCVRSCGHCQDEAPCDPSTGLCQDGCLAGWSGPRCDQACKPYTFGENCAKQCGHCRGRHLCNMVSGTCTGGCDSGWSGERCDQACGHGRYGIDCTATCGHCIMNTSCDHVTGNCLQGCEPGWTGPRCKQRCPPGQYGLECSGTCGRCDKGTCDHVTGTCPQGCARGWRGERCDQECQAGRFGADCRKTCGHCRQGTRCDPVNGICSRGCASGWRAVYCDDECGPGFYGEDCKFRCGRCLDHVICDSVTGKCPSGCEQGFLPPHCIEVVPEGQQRLFLKPVLPVVIVSLVVITIILCSFLTYFMCIRRKRHEIASRLSKLSKNRDDGSLENVYEKIEGSPWELPRSSLTLTQQQLGHGHFGQVRKGFVTRERGVKVPVAVKSLKANASEKDKRDFLNELSILKTVGSHPNVVCLVGACHILGVMYVAMEYCKYGDLRSFLKNYRKSGQRQSSGNGGASGGSLSQFTLLRFALDTASGLQHLAEKQIIHRDVAARNVLLTDHLVAKIADFGLSKHDETYIKTSTTRLPIRWMALESLFNNTYSSQSDVWSFGILLWEIFTYGATPYSTIDTQNLLNCLREGYRLRSPAGCDQNIYAMMLQCWNERPERRPTFCELTGRLQRILEDSQVYMNIGPDDECLYAEIDHDKVTSHSQAAV